MADGEKSHALTSEMEKSVNRLSTPRRVVVELKPLVPRRRITGEAMDHSVKRLYSDSMEHRRRRLQEIEQSANAEIDSYHSQRAKLDAEAEEELVRRMYNDAIERNAHNRRELYSRELSSLVRTNKTLGREEQKAVVSRLYNEGMEKNRKKHIALFDQYVIGRQPKAVQRSSEELMEACDKLWKGEGVTSA